MFTTNEEETIPDCSTAGTGFARTENTQTASESCGLPPRGFGVTDFNETGEAEAKKQTAIPVNCSTAGKGFARTDKLAIAEENCAFPGKSFGRTDFGNKN